PASWPAVRPHRGRRGNPGQHGGRHQPARGHPGRRRHPRPGPLLQPGRAHGAGCGGPSGGSRVRTDHPGTVSQLRLHQGHGYPPHYHALVTRRSPAASAPAATGSQVSVPYTDKVPLPDYRGRPSAQDVCTEIGQLPQNQVSCQVGGGGTTVATGLPAGSVDTQSPAAGTPIPIGQSVTANAVVDSKRVPDLTGMTPTAADAALQGLGYSPVGVPDGTARDQVVVSQQPAPNTPQDGGQVVYHYPAVAAEPMVLYRASNNDEVWVLRFQSDPAPTGYT